MRLDTIEVTNFRCFQQFTLPISGSSLMIVSENAGGKSSLLTAISKALGKDRTIFLTDFADPKQSIEIIATLSGFELADQAIFPKELSFKGKPTLRIGLHAVWDAAENDCEITIGFPDHSWKRASREQREALRILWLPAYRDPSRLLKLAAAQGLFAQLLSSLNLDAALDAASNEISAALEKLSTIPDIANLLLDARNRLAGLIPGVETDAFSIGAEAMDTRDLLREFELLLAHSGVRLPVSRQSNGLGQLAIFVFALRAMAQDSKAILLADEPEISLHPQAQRALSSAIHSLPNQVLIATHSSNILDRADARTIVRLSCSSTGVTASRATSLSAPDAERLSRFVNPQTMEACFARKVILVEGYSDRLVIINLAKELGKDLDAQGISVLCLHGGGAIGAHLQLLGKTGIGLEVLGLCDEDKEAQWKKELQKAGIPATDRATMNAQGFFVCVKDLEHEFIRVLGFAKIQSVIATEGEAGAFALFQSQPNQAGQPLDEQLRRFLHKDNIRWAVPLVKALDLTAIPNPLKELLGRL